VNVATLRRLVLALCCQLKFCHLLTRCDGASACNPARASPVETTRPHINLSITSNWVSVASNQTVLGFGHSNIYWRGGVTVTSRHINEVIGTAVVLCDRANDSHDQRVRFAASNISMGERYCDLLAGVRSSEVSYRTSGMLGARCLPGFNDSLGFENDITLADIEFDTHSPSVYYNSRMKMLTMSPQNCCLCCCTLIRGDVIFRAFEVRQDVLL